MLLYLSRVAPPCGFSLLVAYLNTADCCTGRPISISIRCTSALCGARCWGRREATDSAGPRWEKVRRSTTPDSSSRAFRGKQTVTRCLTRATISLGSSSRPTGSLCARSTLTQALCRALLSLVLSATASSREATMKLRRCVRGCFVGLRRT